MNEETAQYYFGEDGPLGQLLSIQGPMLGSVDYRVSAVYRLPEGNTFIELPSIALMNEASLAELSDNAYSWNSPSNSKNYFKLKKGVGVESLNLRLVSFTSENS